MMEMLKKIFESSSSRARDTGIGVAVALVCACAALAPQEAWGYNKLPNDRILLMNDDSKFGSIVTGQSYSNMNSNADFFWEHNGIAAPGLQKALLNGTDHVMYTKNKARKLWHLVDCRAGCGTVVTRNYIPWDSTAKSIISATSVNVPVGTDGKPNAESAKAVGSVIFRSSTDACLYSPVYEDGIGTIYFDAVNVELAGVEMDLQIATNMINSADFITADSESSDIDWKNVDFNVFTVTGGYPRKSQGTLTEINSAATILDLSAPKAGGPNLFYRVRKQLNYYGPIRFRIRRLNKAPSGTADVAASLVLVDNVIASYPPMTAVLERYGTDYDTTLKGAEVLGCLGDFNVPFLTHSQDTGISRAWYRFVLNDAVDTSKANTAAKIKNAKLVYRWRYLNQVMTDWKEVSFDQNEISTADTEPANSNLVGLASIDLSNGVGDIEYFYKAEVEAPYYSVQDFACSTVKYGAGWSEAITAITNRANYTEITPAGGHDYFVRIREAPSQYEYVQLCMSVTTNLQTTATNALPRLEKVRMELVNTNTWRYCYYVPTNMVGETLSFHFEGKKLVTDPEDAFRYTSVSNTWYCDIDTVPYMPYTSVAGDGFSRDVKVVLDKESTHLIIEFNDKAQEGIGNSYSVSHGTYQNFNTWTDALVGYRGNLKYDGEPTNNATATGVSDVKQKFVAEMSKWEIQSYSRPLWMENFNTSDIETYPLNETFGTSPTPQSSWTAEHGRWIRGARGSATVAAVDQEEVALQMEGRGQGSVALDRDSGRPEGIGTVAFSARIAQMPRFKDFAVYIDGTTKTNYAISAKLTMSREKHPSLNPSDISPARPSVSLVGYYRETKGCYEFRMTRISNEQLACELYKWNPEPGKGMTATLLTSNVVTSLNNGQYAIPGYKAPGQKNEQYTNFSNMLVPKDNVGYWTNAYLFLYTNPDGSVYLECMLSNDQNGKDIQGESSGNQKIVLQYKDADSPLQKGSYGVGSADCRAGFRYIWWHNPATNKYHDVSITTKSINFAGHDVVAEMASGDWGFYTDRWAKSASEDGALDAVMPSSQTLRLEFNNPNDAKGWVYSGFETIITSLNTNRYEFAPCVSTDYKLRLITGGNTDDEVRTDVVVDDLEVTSWRAKDFPDLASTGANGQADQWVYMAGSIESAVEVLDGPAPAVTSSGTNGYAFAFTVGGTYTVVPKMDLIVDRMLLVGGGGAGGWTLGGGGGGGGVVEPDLAADFGTNMVKLAKGEPFVVTVGKGGDNFFVNNNDGTYWNSGGSGGDTKISFSDEISGKATVLFGAKYTAKGGGGGGKWGAQGLNGGSGGGGAQGENNALRFSRSSGTAGQGNSGGRPYGDRAGGGGGASLDADGEGADGSSTKDGAGDGGNGRINNITGVDVYYGGGGGGGGGDGDRTPNSAVGGNGGLGGGGKGLDSKAQSRPDSLNGVDGLGGGGGGGSHGGAKGTSAGGKGGSGAVILHLRTSSKVCTLQPTRGMSSSAMGLRSPYLGNGLSMFTFNYENANSNCVLWLQICTNDVIYGINSMSASRTLARPDDPKGEWKTVREFYFTNGVPNGTESHFMSLRSPHLGFMRLVVAPEVIQTCNYMEEIAKTNITYVRDVDYGKITITGIHCYDEPALDMRSWWGWNLHTEGWNTEDKQYAYLFDYSTDGLGLSASLNFSALESDNDVINKPEETRGIGLTQPELAKEYAANNSFVQCPPLMTGIGTVTFRARTFTTNQAVASQVTLFGTDVPDSDQPTTGDLDWKKLGVFLITNSTYQTFKWSTTDDSTKHFAIRLEVTGTRHGRNPNLQNVASWEEPLPPRGNSGQGIQRVWIDEITASEPIAPRIVFRDVRPFRSHLGDTVDPKPVPNVSDLSEQPIYGESWGIQATVEPQQMSDDLVATSVVVHAAFYNGVVPWGYAAWSNQHSAVHVRLEKVSSNLTFRSTYNNAASVIGPDMTPSSVFPRNVWQYYVWAEYKDKAGVSHVHGLDSTDWQPPSWYYGIQDLNKLYGAGIGERFSGYTIIDSVSPKRAWINEINICDNGVDDDSKKQFIEIAVPQAADLTGWRIDLVDNKINRGTLAIFGDGDAQITKKVGGFNPGDHTNHYTFVTLRSPAAKAVGNCAVADGTWKSKMGEVAGYPGQSQSMYVSSDSLRYYMPYGFALVRPSGVIEHQIVVEATNTWGEADSTYTGTNLLANIRKADGTDSQWFYVGDDKSPGSLGVYKSHGENANCWTNRMIQTPTLINRLEDGTMQEIDPNWFLQPNGTNVWIYASVLGMHVHQAIGINTNNSAVVIIRKGDSTNIVYTTDSWYQIGEVKTNDVVIASARGRGSRTEGHKWVLELKNVEETVNVMVNDERSTDVADAGLDENDPYYNAVMDWLEKKGDDNEGIFDVEFWDLGNNKVGTLDIKDMYWLDINPVESNWVFKAGMGGIAPAASSSQTQGGIGQTAAVMPIVSPGGEIGSQTNIRVLVTMMLTNTTTHIAKAPTCIQGLEPGSSSIDYENSNDNWDSATFKICGALQKDGVRNNYYPLRWFVFGPNSFDENFQALIEISDPHATSSPGFAHGWSDNPDLPIFYKWKLNEEPAHYDTVEMLKADSTY